MIKNLCLLTVLALTALTVPLTAAAPKSQKFPSYGLFGIQSILATEITTDTLVPLDAGVKGKGFILNADGTIQVLGSRTELSYLFRVTFAGVATESPRLALQMDNLSVELSPVIVFIKDMSDTESLFSYTASYQEVLKANTMVSLKNIGAPITLLGPHSLTLEIIQLP